MSSRTCLKIIEKKCLRWVRRNKVGVRMIAFSLAAIMMLSVFSANIVSIVNIFSVNAAEGDDSDPDWEHGTQTYWEADLTLYDYYTDNELKGGVDNNANDGTNRNHIFNQALYDVGYTSKAGEWGNLNYYPLYLGLQYYNNDGDKTSVFLESYDSAEKNDKYNYSLPANSEAGTGTSGAAQGLVDDVLYDGQITQGGGMVKLPYFDEDFLETPIKNLLSNDHLSGLSGSKTLGKISSGYKFRFTRRKGTDYYEYYNVRTGHTNDHMGLKYNASTKIFTTGDAGGDYGTKNDLNGNGGFFPWNYINNVQNYGYGAKFEIPFTMSETGTVINNDGTDTKKPIHFTFAGDDDVWVYIDDHLVLDVGGCHGKVKGEVNFGTKKATVDNIKGSNYYHHSSNDGTVSDVSNDISDVLDEIGLYNDPTDTHTMTVFYMERGSLESNCSISFNFQVADTVSVHNTVDTSKVGSFFLPDTIAVTNKEGIEYQIASNGARTTNASPDAGRDTNKLLSYVPDCTVSFFRSGHDSYTVKKGTTIKLPEGYGIDPTKYGLDDTYVFDGWDILGSEGDESYVTYTVNSDVTFTPQWTKKQGSVDMAAVPKPLLMYVKTTGSQSGVRNGVTLSSVTGGYFANMTGTTTDFWVNIDGHQHPFNGSYTFTNRTGEKTSSINPGDKKYLDLTRDNIYVLDINSSSSSTLYKYSRNGPFDKISSSTVTGFIENYYKFYDALCKARLAIISQNNDGIDTTSELQKYNAALKIYKEATVNTNLSSAISDLQNGVKDITYEYSYEYTGGETTFYIYSESDISGNLVTISNAHTLDPKTYEIQSVEASELPAGTQNADNYYKVTVPSKIKETRVTKQNGVQTQTKTQTYSTEVFFVAGGYTIDKPISDIENMGVSQPCYYSNKDYWKDIAAPEPSAEYVDERVFWVYSENGAPTVKYSSSIESSGLATKDAVLVEDEEVGNYYGYKCPSSVKYAGGSAPVKLTINGKEADFPTEIINDYEPQCYFNKDNFGKDTSGSYSNIDDGWYKLVTACTQTANVNSVYVWKNNTPYPSKKNTWNDGGITTTYISGNYRYCYLPYMDSVGIKLHGNYPDYTLFDYDSKYGDNANWHPEVNSSDQDFYKHTATYKASEEGLATMIAVSLSSEFEFGVVDEEVSDDEIPDSIINPEKTTSDNSDSITESKKSEPKSPKSSGANLIPPASGGNNSEGQFVNDNGSGNSIYDYDEANGVNFKLYYGDPNEEEEAQTVVRQTNNETGGFYLLFGQTAKFTSQFRSNGGNDTSHYGLKISQTGNAWQYTDSDGTDTVDPSKGANGKQSSTQGAEKGLNNRYRTRWVLSDDLGASMKLNRDNYGVYYKSGVDISLPADGGTINEDFTKFSDNGAILFDDILELGINQSDFTGAIHGVELVATYVNEVVVGNLTITKELTDEAKKQIEAYKSIHEDYDPEFKFKIEFSNVFGGDSAAKLYAGSSARYSIGGTTARVGASGIITMKYSQIEKGQKIVISGIPAQTAYKVTEILSKDSNEPLLQLGTVTAYSQAGPDLADENKTSKSFKFDSETDSATGKIEVKLSEGKETGVGLTTGPLAQYYAPLEEKPADWELTVINDVESAYMLITKNINELYYGVKDDPAGLLGTGAAVGGAATSTDDPNGYEAATNAEQSFVFKICEYNSAPIESSTPVKTFYEVISFPKGTTFDDGIASRSKLVKVDPTKYYTVEEVSGWSWKYDFAGVTVTKNGTNGNAVSDKSATVHNFDEELTFNEVTYKRTDTVTFTNNKKTDGTEDVEGDTSIVTNIINKVS